MTSRNRRAGTALIEFAGAMILLPTLLTVIFQLGYTFYTYENLIHAVRAGARYASLRASGSSGDPDFAKSVRNLVVYGDPQAAANARPIAPGLAPENVELALQPATATVSLRGYAIDALFAKVRLDGRPTVTFPLTSGDAR
jgi:Flp pilus assembly protein TadG